MRGAVENPAVAERLTPDLALGRKRLSVGTACCETVNRSNVSLVDVTRTPIECGTRQGMVVDGRGHALA